MGGEEAQHAARERRIDPQRLERDDQRIAAERRAEPRDPRVGHRPVRGRHGQHREIGRRAADPVVHLDARRRDQRARIAARRLGERNGIATGSEVVGALAKRAGDPDRDLHPLARRERRDPLGRPRADVSGRGIEFEPGRAGDAVEARIAELDHIQLDRGCNRPAAPGAPRAAHLEHVCIVGGEPEAYRHLDLLGRIAAQRQRDLARAVFDTDAADQVDLVARNLQRRVPREVRIRLVHEQTALRTAHARREQERRRSRDLQPQSGEKSRTARVQTVSRGAAGTHLAVAIEDRERVAAREHERAVIAGRDRR